MKNLLAPNFAPELASQLRNYSKLMRIDKPIGIWLLLWPTLWGLWLAG
jgi:4-hydroxybenzoate polyprenyltransferase